MILVYFFTAIHTNTNTTIKKSQYKPIYAPPSAPPLPIIQSTNTTIKNNAQHFIFDQQINRLGKYCGMSFNFNCNNTIITHGLSENKDDHIQYGLVMKTQNNKNCPVYLITNNTQTSFMGNHTDNTTWSIRFNIQRRLIVSINGIDLLNENIIAENLKDNFYIKSIQQTQLPYENSIKNVRMITC